MTTKTILCSSTDRIDKKIFSLFSKLEKHKTIDRLELTQDGITFQGHTYNLKDLAWLSSVYESLQVLVGKKFLEASVVAPQEQTKISAIADKTLKRAAPIKIVERSAWFKNKVVVWLNEGVGLVRKGLAFAKRFSNIPVIQAIAGLRIVQGFFAFFSGAVNLYEAGKKLFEAIAREDKKAIRESILAILSSLLEILKGGLFWAVAISSIATGGAGVSGILLYYVLFPLLSGMDVLTSSLKLKDVFKWQNKLLPDGVSNADLVTRWKSLLSITQVNEMRAEARSHFQFEKEELLAKKYVRKRSHLQECINDESLFQDMERVINKDPHDADYDQMINAIKHRIHVQLKKSKILQLVTLVCSGLLFIGSFLQLGEELKPTAITEAISAFVDCEDILFSSLFLVLFEIPRVSDKILDRASGN